MTHYRAVVHYNFKKGMEEKGIKFLENELIKNAQKYGCHYIELMQNEKDHSHLIGIATWTSLDDARRFQSLWKEKEKEFLQYCTGSPEREFCKVRSNYMEKSRRAA